MVDTQQKIQEAIAKNIVTPQPAAGARSARATDMQNYKKQLNELLAATAEKGGSDLHLSPGYYPTIRIDWRLVPLTDRKILDKQSLDNLVLSLLADGPKEKFLAEKELDFAYEISNKLRFRVNVYHTRGSFAAAFRLIPEEIKTLEELNLPPILKIFAKLSQGFVLVVGPNGHGKSTTLAAMIDLI